MSVLAIVPARGGSRGLPGKNLATIEGRSLVARAIDVGHSVERIDDVVVSSDDEDIMEEGRRHGATIVTRPARLAADDTPTIDVIRHVLRGRPGARLVVILQPTSPLRTAQDVEACLDALDEATTATTVTGVDHPVEWSFQVSSERRLHPVLGWDRLVGARQETMHTVRLNGAVYAAQATHLLQDGPLVGPDTVAVPMPRDRSVDVDDELDLVVARAIASRRAATP